MKAMYAALGVAIALAFVCGLAYFVRESNAQVAIVKVFTDQSVAANEFQRDLQKNKNLADVQQALKTYANAVGSIDASSCPKDFRLAWFDYVTSVTDLSEKNLTAAGAVALLEIAMSVWTKDGKLTEDALRDASLPDRVQIYYHRCQRLAVSYGVTFRPAVNPQDSNSNKGT